MIISSPANTLRMQQSPITATEKAIAQQAIASPGFVGTMNLTDTPATATTASTTAPAAASASLSPSAALTPEQEFMNFMKETPAQQYEDQWLKSHNLTRQQLAAMSPEDQKKIMDQMKQDIELKIKEALNNNQIKKTNVSILA